MLKSSYRAVLLVISFGVSLLPAIGCMKPGVVEAPPVADQAAVHEPAASLDEGTPPPLIEYFTASPTEVVPDSSSTLSWSTKNALSVLITPNLGDVGASTSLVVNPTQTTTYTLVAGNATGMTSRTVTVTVAPPDLSQLEVHSLDTAITPPPPTPPKPPVIISFTADPAVIDAGSCSTLVWSTSGSEITALTGGLVSPNGQVCPSVTTTYTLTATNKAGSVAKTCTVTVSPAASPVDTAACEQSLFDAVNDLRTSQGLEAVVRNPFMDELCRQHAQYMAGQNKLSHASWDTRFRLVYGTHVDYNQVVFVENVLQADRPCNAKFMADTWYSAVLDRKNMLEPKVTASGLGLVVDASGKIWVCQLLAELFQQIQPPTYTPAPTP